MKRTLIYILGLILLLVSCSDEPKKTPIMKDFERTEIQLTVVLHDNFRSVSKAYHKKYPKSNRKTTRHGWAVWYNVGSNECTIHVVAPKYLESKHDFETMGHELAHCVYGTFHPEK